MLFFHIALVAVLQLIMLQIQNLHCYSKFDHDDVMVFLQIFMQVIKSALGKLRTNIEMATISSITMFSC